VHGAEALPAALVAAERRNAEQREEGAPEASSPPAPMAGAPTRADARSAPTVTPQHVTSSGAHFRDDQHGCSPLNKPSWQFCWLNRTGNWRESQKATQTFQALAMFAGGVMTWKSNSTVNTVLVGEFWTGSAVGRKYCPLIGPCVLRNGDMTWEILDADLQVDQWHWGGSFSQDTNVHVYVPNPTPANL